MNKLGLVLILCLVLMGAVFFGYRIFIDEEELFISTVDAPIVTIVSSNSFREPNNHHKLDLSTDESLKIFRLLSNHTVKPKWRNHVGGKEGSNFILKVHGRNDSYTIYGQVANVLENRFIYFDLKRGPLLIGFENPELSKYLLENTFIGEL